MVSRQTMGAAFVALLCTSLVTSTIAASMDAQEALEGRKFVTKSNNVKKNPDLRMQSQPQNRPNQPPASPAKTVSYGIGVWVGQVYYRSMGRASVWMI